MTDPTGNTLRFTKKNGSFTCCGNGKVRLSRPSHTTPHHTTGRAITPCEIHTVFGAGGEAAGAWPNTLVECLVHCRGHKKKKHAHDAHSTSSLILLHCATFHLRFACIRPKLYLCTCYVNLTVDEVEAVSARAIRTAVPRHLNNPARHQIAINAWRVTRIFIRSVTAINNTKIVRGRAGVSPPPVRRREEKRTF